MSAISLGPYFRRDQYRRKGRSDARLWKMEKKSGREVVGFVSSHGRMLEKILR
jgi:hypothetical protein